MDPTLLVRIEGLLTANRTHRAQELIREGLASDPEDFDLLMLLARVQHRLGDLDGGLKSCKAALAERPQDPRGHCRQAALLLDKGLPRRALAATDRALEFDPTLGWALVLRVEALLHRAWPRTKAARATTDRLLALWPEMPASHLMDARVANLEKDGGRAEAAFRRALEIQPDYTLALEGLAALLARANRRDEAIALAQAASELELEDPVRRQWARRMLYDGNLVWVPILLLAGPLLVIGIEYDPRFFWAGAAFLASSYLVTRWWRRRQLGVGERTRRFLDRVSREARRLKLRVAGLALTLFVYLVWLESGIALILHPDWRDAALFTVFLLSSAGLATCLHFARHWLRLVPGRPVRPFLWTAGAITLGICWIYVFAWWMDDWTDLTCGLLLALSLLIVAAVIAARLTAGDLIRALWWSR